MLKLMNQIYETSKVLAIKMENVNDLINNISSVTKEILANSEEISAVF